MARVVGILVAPAKRQVLHVAHQFLRDIEADRIPVVGRRRKELLLDGLHLHHRSPFCKEYGIDAFVLERAKDFRHTIFIYEF